MTDRDVNAATTRAKKSRRVIRFTCSASATRTPGHAGVFLQGNIIFKAVSLREAVHTATIENMVKRCWAAPSAPAAFAGADKLGFCVKKCLVQATGVKFTLKSRRSNPRGILRTKA